MSPTRRFKEQEEIRIPGFRSVPKTGVIYVMNEAAKLGYSHDDKSWANFGQGAPETGEIPDSPERLKRIDFAPEDLEYAPVGGLRSLRVAVAELYNKRYRKGRSSLYTADNVAISAGGRLGVTRAVSTLGPIHIGHFLPDYTAYEELLDSFGTVSPIPILLNPARNYAFSADDLREEILGRGLSAVLLSNPCNPTGQVIYGKQLEEWVRVSRELHCSLVLDEFYSHYLYSSEQSTDSSMPLSSSAAEFVEDVERDPVIIIDGLTKNWRYPGFRVSWTIAPKAVIERISSAASFLDGGCSRPVQVAATKLLDKEIADQEARAIQAHFGSKRSLLIDGLRKLGINVQPEPQGGFYVWGDISGLKGNLQDCMQFFREALQYKVITVPGLFFDINPGRRRANHPSRFRHFVRFSYGPSVTEINIGLSSLSKLISEKGYD